MSERNSGARLELATIQPIALDQRHGKARDLFTVWFGSNVMLLTIVTGGLAVTVFGLPFLWAVLGLAVGMYRGSSGSPSRRRRTTGRRSALNQAAAAR